MDHSTQNQDHTRPLIDQLTAIQHSNEHIKFVIKAAKPNGFVVKAAGVKAFVHFSKMPWKYNNMDYWKVVAPHVIKKTFFGAIFQINEDPIFMVIDGEVHRFKDFTLAPNQQYKGVVLAKSTYGAFIDLGYHFNWEYGSMVGLIHTSNFENHVDFDALLLGSIYETTFLAYSPDGKLILGQETEDMEWKKGTFNELIGTIQPAHVQVNQRGKIKLSVQGKYKTLLVTADSLSPEAHAEVKKTHANSLVDGQIIPCEIVGINVNKRHFKIRLLPENELLSTIGNE